MKSRRHLPSGFPGNRHDAAVHAPPVTPVPEAGADGVPGAVADGVRTRTVARFVGAVGGGSAPYVGRDVVPGPGERRPQSSLRLHGRGVAWVIPLVVLIAVVAVDWNTAGEFRVITWIVVVPGLSAALCGVWTTALFAVLSVASYANVDSAWPHQYQNGIPDFILVAAGSLLATAACWVRVRGERRALHLRDVADTTRRTVLRPLPPGWGGLEHAAVYLAADSEARVGGDFYDIQPGPHGTRVLLGDVQGKGLGAVDVAAALLGSFRECGYHLADLSVVAEHLEALMRRHRAYTIEAGRGNADQFATAVLLGFPPSGVGGGKVELVNFGHEPPLAVGRGGVRELPSGDGLPLGLGDLVADRPVVHRVALAPDETLLLVTDGVTEARDGKGVFYPLHARLSEALAADPATSVPARLVGLVRDGTLRHCRGRLADDTTVFAVRPAGAHASVSGGELTTP